jgi:Hyaluronan / mRNA binding family
MTRTARAAYPRAVIKDRSESRTGLDPSIRKSGAGHHNWGSLADELHLEAAAIDDESFEEREIATPLSASLTDSSSSGCKRALHHF